MYKYYIKKSNNQLLIVLLCLLFILISTCKNDKPYNLLLISEPLTNRLDLKTTHDSGCYGYFKSHFTPALIDKESFSVQNLNSLKTSTNINWHIVKKKEPFFNFNKFFTDTSKNNSSDSIENKSEPPKEIKNKIVYLAEVIFNSENEIKFLSVGSDDGFTLWLNGDSVYSHHEGRSMFPNSDIVPIQMKKGDNVLLFKVDQSFGGWSLYYDFVTKDMFEKRFFSEVYSDILEACIIPDTSTQILIKQDPRRKLYKQYSYSLLWKTVENSPQNIQEISYHGNNLPQRISLPTNFPGLSILDIKIIKDGRKTVFREEVPVFFESKANTLAKELTKKNINDDPTAIARRNAVLDLFGLIRHDDKQNREFQVSTRTKSHALLDLYISQKKLFELDRSISGPRIFGYYSNIDKTIQIFRVYYPANLSNEQNQTRAHSIIFTIRPINIVMYDTLTKKPLKSNFLRSRDFCSHSQMMKWIERTTRNHIIVVASHGKGLENFLGKAVDEFPLILDCLKNYYDIDSKSVSIFAYSSGAEITLKLLEKINLEIANVGFIGAAINIRTDSLNTILSNIKHKYPNLRFIIRQGTDDNKEPIAEARQWTKMIKNELFDIDYDEIPYAGHDIGFDRYGDELMEQISDVRKNK